MKEVVMIDRYTKAVLTVIAACLLWLCAMAGARPAQAQAPAPAPAATGAQAVVIVGYGTMDHEGRVALRWISDKGALRTDGVLPVRPDAPVAVTLPYSSESPLPTRVVSITDSPLPVAITGIRRNDGAWDPIRTQVEPDPVRGRPGGGGR